ncbi:MAG: type II toxin-antitoxin system HipA family toxin [Planctomycetes bacterium]|nr:type II toxin-antitoxin system HipA family toxin [Planctomycetota bacterium]
MDVLAVYFFNRPIGTLTRTEGELLAFIYSPEYLADPSAAPLSRSLPLHADAFPHAKTKAFFSGILPEESIRLNVASLLGISSENDFCLLERIGGECAGAVSLVGVNKEAPTSPHLAPKLIGEAELESIVRELPTKPLLAGETGVRLSLAGAQGKLPLILHNDQFFLPRGDAASTHILKPEPERFPGLAANETYCMNLAAAVGLRVAPIEFRSIGRCKVALVERYDRKVDDAGNVSRIHQEDFCQALGFPPSRKYQADGGPTVKQCISLIRDWSTAPILDLADFIKALIFNALIGNADAHGKNFAFLYTGGERRLSPAYDLVSTVAWPGLATQAAMKLGGCDSVNAFGIGDWKKLAMQTESNWIQIRGWLKEVSELVHDQSNLVAKQWNEIQPNVIQELGRSIHARAAKMLTALNDSTA